MELFLFSPKANFCTLKYQGTHLLFRSAARLAFLTPISVLVVTQIATGRIINVCGGEPNKSDITIWRESGLYEKMGEWERGVADKGYQGADGLLTPVKGRNQTATSEYWNNALATIRIHTERVNGAIKSFRALSTKWRGSHHLHRKLFVIVCHFLNVQFKETPIIREVPALLRPTVRRRMAAPAQMPRFSRRPTTY